MLMAIEFGTVDGGAGSWSSFGSNWTDSAGSANAGWGGSVGIFAGSAGGTVSVSGTVSFALKGSRDGEPVTLPDLESFNLTLEAVHGLPISAADVWLALVYGAGYATLVLFAAVAVFSRRDFH